MKYKIKICQLACIVFVFYLNPVVKTYSQKIHDFTVNSNQRKDSLKLLDATKLDFGLNHNISLNGDETYKMYKNRIRFRLLEIETKSSSVFVQFEDTHLVERIIFNSQRVKKLNCKNLLRKDTAYHTDKLGFAIGDSFSYVVRKLDGGDYKIEKNYPAGKDTCLRIHGLLRFQGIYKIEYDEYMCIYCFINSKLDLIEIDYFRDVNPLISNYINSFSD